MVIRLIIFFVLNFGALALGGLFTGNGVISDWYQNLNQAPWTPPGWVFGFAWTTIMVFFTLYMSFLWEKSESKLNTTTLYGLQWVLNVSWNPVFFYYHQSNLALVLIILLTVLVVFMTFYYLKKLKGLSFLIAPYLIWMVIATSLNLYISLNN